jgi:hypothetical protein
MGRARRSQILRRSAYALAVCIAAMSTMAEGAAESCHHMTPDGRKNCIRPGSFYESKDLPGYYHLPVDNICEKHITVTAVCGNGHKFSIILGKGHDEIVAAPCGGFSGWYESGCEGEQSRNNSPARRNEAGSGTRTAKVDSSFCALWVDEIMRDGCYTTCATGTAAACASFRHELGEYKKIDSRGLMVSSGSLRTSSTARNYHYCDRGQIWSNATTGHYRCECPPGEYIDQGGPCR